MKRPLSISLATLVVLMAIPAGARQAARTSDFVLPFPGEYRTSGLPPYAELVLKLDANASLPSYSGVSIRLKETLDRESPSFEVLWWHADGTLLHRSVRQQLDLQSLAVVSEVPKLPVGVYLVQVRMYHPESPSTGKQSAVQSTAKQTPRLIAEPVESNRAEILIASGYAISVTPATARPGEKVEIALSTDPSPAAMASATVTFGGTEVPVLDRRTHSLSVDVPINSARGSRPDIRVTLHGADGGSVTSEAYSGFTVEALKDQTLLNWSIALLSAIAGLGVAGSVLFVLNRCSLEKERARWLAQVRELDSKRANDAVRNSTLAAAVQTLKEQLNEVADRERISQDGESRPQRAARSSGHALIGMVPDVPPELVAACKRGQCVLYAGRGVGAMGGLPTWREGLGLVLDLAAERFPDKIWEGVKSIYQSGDLASVTDLLCTRVSWDDLIAMVRHVFNTSGLRWPDFYTILGDFPFAGIYSGNWDPRITEAVRPREPVILTTTDFEAFEPLLQGDQFFLLNVDGDLDRPETVVFSTEQYRKALTENDWCSKFVSGCLAAKTMFFVGASLQAIENFLSGLRLGPQRGDQTHRHFALVELSDDFDAHSERFLYKYGIRLLGFRSTEGYPEVTQFLSKLKELAGNPTTTRHTERTPRLDRIVLKNIGLFKALDLDLQAARTGQDRNGAESSTWNVVLGNNGCGKSTLLRAVVLGLCGDDREAREAAGRLLRVKENIGSIELSMGHRSFTTNLRRETDGRVVVESSVTPLQAGRWVVLGFPALRGATQRDPSGLGPAGRGEPVVRDVLPLLLGVVDWRLDGLKQWIVDTEALSHRTDLEPGQAERHRRALDNCFDLLGAFIPGVTCRLAGVDPKTFRVTVLTDDGLVPIDQLSQGTGSVIGWVGTLFQRMQEIYRDAERPQDQPALVLIDELDAHMHPEWQQLLVPTLKVKFPKLQVLATTHSPLVVLSMAPGEIVKLEREGRTPAIQGELGDVIRELLKARKPDLDAALREQLATRVLDGLRVAHPQPTGSDSPAGAGPGAVSVRFVMEKLEGMTAAQALTGPLDLLSARDRHSAAIYVLYTELAAKANRTDEEQEILRFLAEDLKVKQPPSNAETAEARKASAAIEEMIQDQFKAMGADKKKKFMDEVVVQLTELSTRSRRPG